jgi:hypothetical protein
MRNKLQDLVSFIKVSKIFIFPQGNTTLGTEQRNAKNNLDLARLVKKWQETIVPEAI